ncbi:MAG TPA: HK97 family phage prohead protease [Caulobacteraceae bacterium]|nr:HK97 family phage prohead protease [Caulobacteraceae bacterium]
MRLFGQLTKIEDQPDGTLKVFGVASTGARDDVGEVVRPEAMKAALPDYARYPALREMHQPSAAGRTLEAQVDDDGVTRIVAHVVDPVAIAKVKSRTYSGFSIGGRVLARDPADASVITRIKLTEISLVDRPANPEAVIDLWKADAYRAAPNNEAVKARAAEMATVARRPKAWKDYVAKARAALVAEQAAEADEENDETGWADRLPSDATSDDDLAAAPAPSADQNDAALSDDEASADDDDSDPSHVAMRLADIAAADPASLQTLHDVVAALGATCDASNCRDSAKASQGQRVGGLESRTLLEAALARSAPRLDALERRLQAQDALIERIAATPLPPRTAASPYAHAIGKADDADPSQAPTQLSASDLEKAFDALTPDERAFLLMKATLRQPIPLP